MSGTLVVGIDGCRKGWIAVATREGRFEAARVYPDVQRLVEAWSDAAVFAIDMPLSFPESYPRRTETAVREYLERGAPSLFPTMPRKVLVETTYEKAVGKARSTTGKGITRQAYALRKKMFEVESLLSETRDRRFFEVHPEVSFRVLAAEVGAVVDAPKRSWNGHLQRLETLRRGGVVVPAEPIEGLGGAGTDDVLDAAVTAWTGHRIRRGMARSFPSDLGDVEERCPNGREGVIWA